MQNYTTDQIRNVVLLSHSGAGKTSLSEAMLFTSGAIPRMGKTDEGTTCSDYEPEEQKREISINLSVLPCSWKDNKINLLDTPGYDDFIGAVMAGTRVADGAIIVICATSGIEVGTELMWNHAEEKALPRFIFINKMDRENANFDKVVAQVQEKFGRKCIPIQLPIGSHSNFKGIVDLIAMKAYCGGKEEEIDSAMESQVSSFREKLIEAVAEVDDELTMKYLDGGEISTEEIYRYLGEGVKTGKIVPVLTGSAFQNAGTANLLDAICSYLPSPKEAAEIAAINPSTKEPVTIEADEKSPLAALVFMTSADPFVGKLTFFRVYSGSIDTNAQLWNANKEQTERLAQLFLFRGKSQETVQKVIAGDIGATAKLAAATTGDTFSSKERPLN
ncbi:GTP-binding protein, partial [Chloroflexota bacterium]